MRRVVVLTPTYDGKVGAAYADALAASVKLCLARGIDLLSYFMCYDAKIHNARNDLMALALRTPDVSDIIWIDADIDWQPDWVLRLLDHPVDVVGGTYQRKGDGEVYEVGADPDQLVIDAAGLMQVRHLGTGFLRLSLRACAALWEGAPAYRALRGEQRRVFGFNLVKTSEGDQEEGEDVGMCRRLRELGFAINLDPGVTCRHTGTKTWSGDFSAWALKLQAVRAVRTNIEVAGTPQRFAE